MGRRGRVEPAASALRGSRGSGCPPVAWTILLALCWAVKSTTIVRFGGSRSRSGCVLDRPLERGPIVFGPMDTGVNAGYERSAS